MTASLRPLLEHVGLFVLMVTICSVVYSGLRREGVRDIVLLGLRRALFFVVVCLLLFGVGGYLIANWL